MGDEAEDLVCGKAKRHGAAGARHHTDVIKLADGAIDAEPLNTNPRIQIDDLDTTPRLRIGSLQPVIKRQPIVSDLLTAVTRAGCATGGVYVDTNQSITGGTDGVYARNYGVGAIDITTVWAGMEGEIW